MSDKERQTCECSVLAPSCKVASTDLRVAARQLPGRGLAADLSLDSDDDSMVSSFEIIVKFQVSDDTSKKV